MAEAEASGTSGGERTARVVGLALAWVDCGYTITSSIASPPWAVT
jgi:hypothetical protein